jgi:hypothetical protein
LRLQDESGDVVKMKRDIETKEAIIVIIQAEIDEIKLCLSTAAV